MLGSISGERRTVVSQHGSGPLSVISFLHRCNFLMKTFTVLITYHAAVVGEKSKWEWSMFIYKNILQPSFWYKDNMSSINSLQFSTLIFPGKLVDETRPQAFFSSPWSRLLNISSLKNLWIWGPTKTPSFNFRFAESWGFFSQILKRRSSPVHGFYEVFHQTEFDVAVARSSSFLKKGINCWWRLRNEKIWTFFSRTFHCLSLDPSTSALLLDSSRSRTRSFSSSCVKMCGCVAEDLQCEMCGSVGAGGSGEPEVDSPSSSSSEVNSFGGSGTEVPSPCRTGRRADGIFRYTTVHLFFFVMPPETGGTIQK